MSVLGSLRTKFGLTATAGLLVAVVMTVLLIVVARRSEEIVNAAHETQQRIATLLNLQNTLDRFQIEAFIEVREGPVDPARFQAARDDFIAAANQIQARPGSGAGLPAGTADELHAQAMRVLALFDRRLALGRQIDDIWERYATRQALEQVRQTYADFYVDYFNLRQMIHAEIPLENQRLQHALERAQTLRQATTPAALVCLILALLGYGVVFSLVWGRLSPGLGKLERTAMAVAAGEPGRPVGLRGNDELARVSRAFDYMAGQLAQKQQSLQEFAERQEAVVAERTRELEGANHALAAVDQRRRAFLADISHELRTPLAIISGEAQMALRSDDETTIDPLVTLERILSQARSLSRLVDDLFLIARAGADGLILHELELDLAALAARVARDVAGIAQELGVHIAVQAQAPVWAIADPDRVRQVLIGLIDNALRHARAASGSTPLRIILAVRREDDAAAVAVIDNGPGFAPGTLTELFGRFRRGSSGGEGTGLGLAVVRALVEAMGGSAELANRPEGGAMVTLKLRGAPRDSAQESKENSDVVPAAG